MLGLRLGGGPRVVVTTTPRANAVMRRVKAAPGVAATFGKTRENPWLPDDFVIAMLESYGGTRLGRQELDGEMLEDVEGALWTRRAIERCRVEPAAAAKPVRVVIGVDRSEEHTSELQSLMRNSYAVFCLKKKTKKKPSTPST